MHTLHPSEGHASAGNTSAGRTRRSRFVLAAVGALTALAGLAGMAAPEPDPVPRRWQLDVKLGPLRVAKVDVPGGTSKAYFYLTYKVTNASGTDVLLAPAWDLATSDGRIARSGRNVPAAVTQELLKTLHSDYLEDQISIIGVLMQGEENAKDGLVVWAIDDLRVNEVDVFAAGFSGESKPMEVLNPSSGEKEKVLLRKTLMARYSTPGEIENQGSAPFDPAEVRWIMR